MPFPQLSRVLSAAKKAGATVEDLTPATFRDRFTGEEKDNTGTLYRHYVATKGKTRIEIHTQAGYPDETKAVVSLMTQRSPSTDVMTDYFCDRFFDTIKAFKAALVEEKEIR